MRFARPHGVMIVAILLLLGASLPAFSAEVVVQIPKGALPAEFFDRLPEGVRHNAQLRADLQACSGYAVLPGIGVGRK
jgi:hypothetical protein